MGSRRKETTEIPWTRGVRSGGPDGEDAEVAESSIRLPWSKATPQVQGRLTERRILKARGARVHPNSGAGRIKEDGSDQEAVYEVKETQNSYRLVAKELRQTRRRAARQGKQSIWIIKFPGFIVECRILPDREYEVDDD